MDGCLPITLKHPDWNPSLLEVHFSQRNNSIIFCRAMNQFKYAIRTVLKCIFLQLGRKKLYLQPSLHYHWSNRPVRTQLDKKKIPTSFLSCFKQEDTTFSKRAINTEKLLVFCSKKYFFFWYNDDKAELGPQPLLFSLCSDCEHFLPLI